MPVPSRRLKARSIVLLAAHAKRFCSATCVELFNRIIAVCTVLGRGVCNSRPFEGAQGHGGRGSSSGGPSRQRGRPVGLRMAVTYKLYKRMRSALQDRSRERAKPCSLPVGGPRDARRWRMQRRARRSLFSKASPPGCGSEARGTSLHAMPTRQPASMREPAGKRVWRPGKGAAAHRQWLRTRDATTTRVVDPHDPRGARQGLAAQRPAAGAPGIGGGGLCRRAGSSSLAVCAAQR